MHEVEELFAGVLCQTRFWISDAATKAIDDYLSTRPQEAGKLAAKLKYYAQAGFLRFEGEGNPIKHEWDGVYRIAWEGLFRIVGFYEDDRKKDFIAIDAFLKKKTKLSAKERDR